MKNKKTEKYTTHKCCNLHLRALDRKDEQIMSLMLDNLNYKRKLEDIRKKNECYILNTLQKIESTTIKFYKKYLCK